MLAPTMCELGTCFSSLELQFLHMLNGENTTYSMTVLRIEDTLMTCHIYMSHKHKYYNCPIHKIFHSSKKGGI